MAAPAPAAHLLSVQGTQRGWPAGFTPLDALVPEDFPAAGDVAGGRIRLLGEERSLADGWEHPDAARLWRFHLHYLEWAWPLVTHPDRLWARATFRRLWSSWQASSPFPRGDPWSPYVASVRLWLLCSVHAPLVAGSDVEEAFVDELRLHAGYVRVGLERDIGGNHLLKNLKALIGAAVFLGDGRTLRFAARQLERQLGVQVLADGGHYERSPSYHCQVLGDLLDVQGLLQAAGAPLPAGLTAAVAAMRQWLGSVLMPDGDVPLFNDCVLVGLPRLAALAPAPRPTERSSVLADSGYVVLRPEPGTQLVLDAGWPCPPDLPPHAHADTLAFELFTDGRRLVVDTGTSTYEPGERRAYERSTAAHNTVEVDGVSSTEVWDVFRAARLARPHLEAVGDDDGVLEVVASHDGYERLPGRPRHRRTLRLAPGRLELFDELVGKGWHRVRAHLHLAPGATLVKRDATTAVAGQLLIEVEVEGSGWDLEVLAAAHEPDGWTSSSIGDHPPAPVLRLALDGELPLGLTTVLRW